MNSNIMTKEISVINYSPSHHLIGQLEKTIIETDKIIQYGLSKETAGTGTPISKLKGMAKPLAQFANVGGGSKANGGGGVEEGLKVIVDNIAARSALDAINQKQQNKKFLE